MELSPGHVVGGKYRIDAKLGEGGMGAVYKAWDTRLDRPVALKVIRPALAQDESFRARFEREAKAVARLKHPNAIEIYDYDHGDGGDGPIYMAFEFLEARELSELIRAGELTPLRTVWIVSQILSCLETAHRAGIIHRDLKPQNVMIERSDDRVKILDFGIAKMKNPETDVSLSPLTMAGQVMGTVYYMSPEQAEGRSVDGRSDIYSVGVMLYLMLTGRLPFKSKKPIEILDMHLHAPVPPLGAQHLAPFEPVVQKAMAKVPADRFASAAEFRAALESAVPAEAWGPAGRPAPPGRAAHPGGPIPKTRASNRLASLEATPP
ncbi:MAG: serine/threonine protein kinase, partial [Planctomycetota bacterium]